MNNRNNSGNDETKIIYTIHSCDELNYIRNMLQVLEVTLISLLVIIFNYNK